jgi:multiple sugar transport system ATP-binding protein
VAAIRFDNVTKRFGDVVAVNRLDLAIRDKEFLVLLGPSGCGKSTTLNMIAGLETPTEGEISFDGQVVNAIPPHRRDVAMVFQSYALYPHKTVYDNIGFGLRMRKYPTSEIDRRVREAAGILRIADLLDRRPHQLSGGQRQRVALGRAMVRQPAVFLMDEPLSNLDAGLRVAMRAELRELHRRMRTTFVYVTHDQAEALTLADQIVVMQDGVVQQIGNADEIYERPRNVFVASFLGNPRINLFRGTLVAHNGRIMFRSGWLGLGFPSESATRLLTHTGRDVILGIRPEDVDERISDPTGAIRGRISFVMPVGSDQLVGLRAEDQDVFFRVAKESRYRAGDDIALGVNLNRLHVFDRDTTRSLLWDGPA